MYMYFSKKNFSIKDASVMLTVWVMGSFIPETLASCNTPKQQKCICYTPESKMQVKIMKKMCKC